MKRIVDPQQERAAADARKVLDETLRAPNTVLCVVFGEDADADEVSKRAEKFAASDMGCKRVQVVRIRDAGAILAANESAAWGPKDGNIVTVLTFKRHVFKRLTAKDARDGQFLIDLVEAGGSV